MNEVKLLYEDNQWSFQALQRAIDAIEQIAKEELQLDMYTLQIEIINSDQMLDGNASVAMPIIYQHWSFGLILAQQTRLYRKGHVGLPYETILNTSPSITFLLQDNTM